MNPEHLLDQLSQHLKNTIARAISLAGSLKHTSVEPLHLLFSLTEERGSLAHEIIEKMDIEKTYLEDCLASLPMTEDETERERTVTLPGLNAQAKYALEKAMLLAYEHQSAHVGTEHLLYGLIHASDVHIERMLKKFNIDHADITTQIESIIETTNHFPEMDDVNDMMEQLQDMIHEQPPSTTPESTEPQPISLMKLKPKKPKAATALEIFTLDLTNKATQKTIDPVVGREKEIERVVHILSRRNKNNPVLVGEPGVGKTAIVEGLAKRISQGNVPTVLRKKRILSLDLTLLIAGTIYRGEFEARLKQIIDEVAKNPNIILFIDELHNIIGAGSNQGTMDAANILKPALARGQLRCIGATTIDEYKKHITSDPALERRFQSVNVEEPSHEETKIILDGVKKFYEQFHHVTITPEAIDAAVTLSTKYIHDHFLPDKALDLIDEASAAVKTRQKPSQTQKKLDTLFAQLDELSEEKETAIKEERFEDAMKVKQQEQKVEKKIKALESESAKSKQPRAKVTKEDIAHILGTKLNIDAELLMQSTWDTIRALPATLKERIIGQDQAISTIVRSLEKAQLGLKKTSKPMASFLFAGPSGVGKTALATELARVLYHDEKALIRLDMSEFAEQHGISKLLGSPAGYIGHKERNRFTDNIRKRPYSVILFDEIDKAHPDVIKLLLQILDEGQLTDSNGKKIIFAHAIIIMTTNLGAQFFTSSGIGFGGTVDTTKNTQAKEVKDKAIQTALKEALGPAITGRIDASVLFYPLQQQDIESIISRHIHELNASLTKTAEITITPDAKALTTLAANAYNKDTGVRQVEQIVEDTIATLVQELLQTRKKKKRYTLTHKQDSYQLV